MADLSLLQDSQEVAECLLDFVSQDELLTPLGRIDKYISSENVFNRQMVARSLLDTLRAVSEDERECVAVLEKINRLADDSEPTVRAELMEQIPHIALFILENQNLLQNQNQEQEQILPLAFSRILLPVLLRCLNDQNNLVRKTSQAALLVLLEQRVIGQWDLEQRVCPVLVDLTAPHSNDDLKTEAMAEVTERLFLPRFCEMCCDCRMFHVRKVCAASFGDMCSVVGGEATEELLLPRFYQLCSDNVWGVRKACAECFMSVSAAASPETRQNKLSALFINLISDPSRWVRQAAFQSLGQFISTFASPDCISYNPSGCQVEEAELHLAEEGGGEERAESLNPEELGQGSSSEAQMDPPGPTLELESSCVARPGQTQVEVLTAALSSLDPRFEEEAFLEPRVAPSNPCSCLEGSEQQFSHTKVSDSALCSTHEDCDSDGSDGNMNPEDDRKSRQQDVVPQALLDQYLSMTDPSRAQTVDMEIAKHCAYSLPGVALTLGRQNWHCLRDTYETLASDMQWKVRRTLAFSLHELAGILGDRITATHLLPVFNSFLKDLDEVRIGVLKHLYDFLKLLRPDTRRQYLYQLQEFLVTDNSRNWRFRSELAEQLVLLLELYSPQDVHDYLRPLAFCLCSDRVSSVRWTAYRLVTEMVRKLSSCSSLLLSFLSELVEKFGRSPKWSCRQAFAFLCQVCVEDDCVSLQNFSEYLLPALLCLASDPVPNVRVLLAKTLRQTLLQKEYFLCHQQEALEHTLLLLQTDGDKDVKYFASYHPGSTRMNEDAMSTTSSTY
ncbi:hypothetical protein DNTS_015323 [Danionella cerebrum]|uniref:Uncharacterized protein n=1 Tax=Danionella cerebrum TaxID=2873325 RepID=A0A553NWQ2_9TELE|nr:hypothetical protein DNTS_015323 [Danionella translucida]